MDKHHQNLSIRASELAKEGSEAYDESSECCTTHEYIYVTYQQRVELNSTPHTLCQRVAEEGANEGSEAYDESSECCPSITKTC